jgi:hypothetical protein
MQESSQVFRVLYHYLFPATPLPPGGYFGRKILIFSDLQTVCAGKILIAKGLRLKYLFSIN